MIALIRGVLTAKDGDAVLLLTDGGVGYNITVPLGVLERLPPVGQRVTLHTELVVREDAWALFGFDRPTERGVFQRLLGASGFGPKLALALLSTLGADRTVRSIQQRDLAALSSVSGIGKKKAERLVLELRDRFSDFPVESIPAVPRPGEEAMQALVGLGYPAVTAEGLVRDALAAGPADDVAQLVRRALQKAAK